MLRHETIIRDINQTITTTMTETLNSIIIKYNLGLLNTSNLQLIKKTFSNETIDFPDDIKKKNSLRSLTFKELRLINVKFIDLDFTSSYFENCLIENCIFNSIDIRQAEWENCIFKNCQFFKCNLSEVFATEVIFENCKFVETGFANMN